MAKSDISRGIDFKYKANRKIAPYTISYFYPNDSEYKLASFMNSDGYFGYMNEEGLVVIPPIYLEARDFKSFNNSLRAIVMEKEHGRCFRLIDENGNNISSLYEDMYFDGDFIVAKRNKKYGILNTNGKEVEPFIYDEISNGVGKIIVTSGKYKGYVKYYYFYNGNINSRYGKPLSRTFEMATQEIPDDRNCVKYSREGEAYINPLDLFGRKAYVNIESGQVLLTYNPITDFKELEISKGFVDLRAIALDGSTPQYICLIDRKGHKLLSVPFQFYMISETKNNMYLLKSKRENIYSLFDMNGNYIVGECYHIKVCDCGLIIARKENYELYDLKGHLIDTDKEYINVIGNKNDEYLVAEYYDENKKLKSEIIDRKGKRVIKNIHYDNTTGFVNGYAVLEINKTDYSMNDPYHYNEHKIVDISGNVISKFPKDNSLNSFETVKNYADNGFFIAKYLNKKVFSVLGLNGKEIFNIECDNLTFKNGIFIASYKQIDGLYIYKFYDKNGCDIFNGNYSTGFIDYEFLSDKCFTVTNHDETIFISFSNAEVVDINSIPHTSYYGYWNINEPFIKELGSDLSKREKILCRDVTQEYTNIKRYILVDKNHTKIKPLLNTWSLCIKKTDNGSECCEIIGEIKDKLKYFDLSVNSFYGIDVRGIDFSETNAFIDPQIVYNRSLDGCKLNSSNLTIHKSKLKELGISCEGTIIDGELVEKGHERKLIL